MRRTLVLLSLLGACTPAIDYARQNCADYGFLPGTERYAECLQAEVGAINTARQQSMQAAADSLEAARAQAARDQAAAMRAYQSANPTVTINRGYGW
jgi:hypothetical protein